MPIKPENKKLYPKNWKEISEIIRFGRAKGRCENCGVFLHKSIIMNWKRYRLKTYAVSDNRPLIFNPKYPWWCSGYGENDKGEYSVIIAYLPKDEDLLKYWDDTFEVEFTEEESISFSDRFPKPSYFVS